jgi:hypothetical protein
MSNSFNKKFNLLYLINIIFFFFFILNFIFFFSKFIILLLLSFLLFTHHMFFYFFLKYENSKNYFPILPLISFFFFLSFTFVFFIEKNILFNSNFQYSDFLPKTILILILGLNFLFFGYIISEKIFIKKKKKFFYFDYNLKKKLFILFFFVILSFLINFNQFCSISFKYSFINQLREPVNLFVLGLILMMILKNNIKSFLWHILFALILLIIYTIETSEAFIATIFCTSIFLLAMYFYIKKKIPFLGILFSIFLLLLSFYIKRDVRNETWFKNYHCSEKIVTTLNILKFKTKFLSEKNVYSIFSNELDAKTMAGSRILTNIYTLNKVIALTPEKVAFFEGSYTAIYTKFIPRLLWSDKPTEIAGNFWGHRYHFIDLADNLTSWNFGVLPEFYANFGIFGVLFGMFLLGLFIKFLIIKLSTKKFTDIEMLISSIIIFNFFYLEVNLSLILGKVINQFIFFNIFFLFFYLFLKFISKINRIFSL